MSKKRILVIAGLQDSQVRYKLVPLAMSEWVGRLYFIRKRRGPEIHKVEYIVLPPVCRWRGFYLILAPLYAIFFSRARKVDFILAYHLVPHGVFALIASMVTGRPFIYSQIDMDIQKYTCNDLFKKLIIMFLKKAAYVNVPGSNSKKFWVNLGIVEDRINILHSTIDTENEFFPAEKDKEYDFICVGRLEHRKRVDRVVSAVERLVASGYNARLAIIGDGPAQGKLLRQTQSLGVSVRVRFFGHQSNIRDFLNKSKIFVLISENEGLPCALMEAMACELLVVASDVGDIRDVLIDRKTGFLVNGHLPDAVFRSLREAYFSYDKSGPMRRKAREKIAAEHSYPAALKKWDALLKNMPKDQEPPGPN
jgi:glycosyltransferase involved in cell wall biosynthesis